MSEDGSPTAPRTVHAASDAAAFGAAHRIGRLAAARIAPGSTFVSLGQNCNTARYLQLVGTRTAAYPFDWIFSSPAIVEHCIGDGFATFGDRALIVARSETAAGHAHYHAAMFNHRSPLVGGNADYYRRCVARFTRLYRSDAPIVFVSTSLPEHERRPGWSRGFVHAFPAPENRDAALEYSGLAALLARRGGPTSLIVIEQRTCMPHRRLDVVAHRSDRMVIRFDACAANNGIDYLDPIDDALCRTLYAGLADPGA